jgi:hypothetical protein
VVSLLCPLTCKYSNQVSLQAIDEQFDGTEAARNEVEEISDTKEKTIQDGSEEREDHGQVKLCLRALFSMLCYSVGSLALTLSKRNMARCGGLANFSHGSKCFLT